MLPLLTTAVRESSVPVPVRYMKLKTFTIIVILAILMFGGGLSLWFFLSQDNLVRDGAVEEIQLDDLFPEGGDRNVEVPPRNNREEGTGQKNQDESRLPENEGKEETGNAQNQGTPTPPSDIGNVRLIKLFDTPVAGFGFIEKSDEGVPVVRTVERETGNVFDIVLDETPTPSRITNQTIGSVQNAVVHGNSIAFQYFDSNTTSFKTILAEIGEEDSTGFKEVRGTLISGVPRIVASNKKDTFFYLNEIEDGGSEGFLFSTKTKEGVKVFDSPFASWIPYYSTTNTIGILSKPSWLFRGSFITEPRIDVPFGSFNGLSVTPSKSFTEFLISYVERSDITLESVQTVFFNENRTFFLLPYKTLAEKCYIAQRELLCAVPASFVPTILKQDTLVSLPDAWYQGIILFNDAFVSTNKETGVTTTLLNTVVESEEPIDVEMIQGTSDGLIIVFINKYDLSLWAIYRSL